MFHTFISVKNLTTSILNDTDYNLNGKILDLLTAAFQVNTIYITIGLVPKKRADTSDFDIFISLLLILLIVPGDTYVPHKTLVISPTRQTKTPARYISINDSSTVDSLWRYRSIMAVSKGIPLSLGTFNSTFSAVVWKFHL